MICAFSDSFSLMTLQNPFDMSCVDFLNPER